MSKSTDPMTPPQSTGFAAPTDEIVAGLVGRLRAFAEGLGVPADNPGGFVALEAATALSTLAAERDAARKQVDEWWSDIGHALAAKLEASEARATALEGERDELRTKVEHLAKQEVDIRASYCLVRADNAELARENKRLDREWEAAEVGAKEARAALKPFADLGVGSGPDDEADNQPYRILRGAIRRARSILEG